MDYNPFNVNIMGCLPDMRLELMGCWCQWDYNGMLMEYNYMVYSWYIELVNGTIIHFETRWWLIWIGMGLSMNGEPPTEMV